jgi:hypothetical protein
MQNLSTMRRARRKGLCPDLFDWQQNRELLSNATVRAIAGRGRVTPATAALISELAFATREARNV